jgi:hypothetical protein
VQRSAAQCIAGFESSSNFVESQQPGVFRQTLRNMCGYSKGELQTL